MNCEESRCNDTEKDHLTSLELLFSFFFFFEGVQCITYSEILNINLLKELQIRHERIYG